MMRRLVMMTVLVALPLTACSRRQPPESAQPMAQDTAGDGARLAAERERMRQDSIARANARDTDTGGRAAEATARARAILEESVHFDYDEADLRPDAAETLGRKVPILRANPNVRLRIVGHTDERGSVEYNLALGMRRANAVRQYLGDFGIDPARFEATSMGEDSPRSAGSNESAWAQNRRAEFVITAGGSPLMLPGN